MITVAKFRDNLLVTAGMRIAYMDDQGLIDIPRGVEGEHKISKFVANRIDNYPVGCDVNFDEYIESAIHNEYGVKDKEIVDRTTVQPVIFESRSAAETVLYQMNNLLQTYGCVTVANFYDLCDVKTDYVNNKYGWINLSPVQIIRNANGYELHLPKALPID